MANNDTRSESRRVDSEDELFRLGRRSYMQKVGAAGAGMALGGGGTASLLAESVSAVDTVLDDFEDGDISEYDGHTGRYTVQGTTTLEGSWTLEATQTYGKIGHSTQSTPRGYEYRCRVMAGSGSTGAPGLLVSAQDPADPWDDCYFVGADSDDDTLYLFRREADIKTELDSVGVTIDEGTEYQLAVELDDDTVKGVLYDSSGTELAATAEVTDTTHTGGTFGFYAGGGTPVYFDYVIQTELPTRGIQTFVIDDFEDGDLVEYAFDKGSSGATTVTTPVHHGSFALQLSGTDTEMISTSGLNGYPSQGDSILYRVRATGGAGMTNFTYGVQDHGNRYFIRVDFAEDELELHRFQGGSSTDLDITTTSSALTEDTWYAVEIDWSDSGQHTATLSDQSGNQLAQVSAVDTTWTSGGVGFDAYLASSGGTIYYDHVTMGQSAENYIQLIDGFEDSEMSEYVFENGNESLANVTANPTFHGNRALELNGAHFHLNSLHGLDQYPQAGDVFSGWVRGSSNINGSLVITYGVQDFENRYYAYVDIAGGTIRIRKKENDTITTLAEQTGIGLSTDTWYELEVDWGTDGTHVLTIYDAAGSQLGQASASNEVTWTEGGIGYNAHTGNGASGYFDLVRIKSRDHRHLLVESFDHGLDDYVFEQGSASVVASPSYSGANALKIDGTDTRLYSTGSSRLYPTPGDCFAYWIRAANGADQVELAYGVQSNHVDRYTVQVNFAASQLKLLRKHSGGTNQLASATLSALSYDTWYGVQIEWNHHGGHTVMVTDSQGTEMGSVSSVDSVLTTGGIGYEAFLSSGGTAYYDFFTLKQTDLPNEVTLTNPSSSSVNYSFDVTGQMKTVTTEAPYSTVSDSLAASEAYTYSCSGEVSRCDDGQIEFVIDRSTDEITVRDLDGSSPPYEVSVTGSISAVDADNTATISNGTASGSVSGSEDVFSFTGDVAGLKHSGTLEMTGKREYIRLVNNPYPNATVAELAGETAVDPNNDRIAFTSNALDNSTGLNDRQELYLATGVTSADQQPAELFQISRFHFTGITDLSWTADEGLQSWVDGSRVRQEALLPDDFRRPIPQSLQTFPPFLSNGGGS